MRYHVSSVFRVARVEPLMYVIERPVFVRPARDSWICRVLPIRMRRGCLEVAIRQEWCQRAWLFIYVLAQHGEGVSTLEHSTVKLACTSWVTSRPETNAMPGYTNSVHTRAKPSSFRVASRMSHCSSQVALPCPS